METEGKRIVNSTGLLIGLFGFIAIFFNVNNFTVMGKVLFGISALMVILIASLTIIFIGFRRTLKELEVIKADHKKLQEYHQSLSLQFDGKVAEVESYKDEFSMLRLLFHQLIINTTGEQKEKIEYLQKAVFENHGIHHRKDKEG